MKTLIVAPRHEDLTLSDAEVQRLVNALSAKIVIGTVDCTDVVDAIAAHQPELIWFLSHGSWEGIVLSDCLFTGDMLASSIRGTPAKLLVLNSCHSRAVAERIFATTGCHVVATRGAVTEQNAFVVAARFATLVAGGMDPHDAYLQARTDDFIYVPDGGALMKDENLRREVDGLTHRVGSNERTLGKLDAKVDEHDSRLTRVETQFSMMAERVIPRQFDGWSWVLIALFLALAGVVFAIFGGAGWLWGG